VNIIPDACIIPPYTSRLLIQLGGRSYIKFSLSLVSPKKLVRLVKMSLR